MPAVDVDRMPPAQRAAWDRLWRVLLAPEPQTQGTRAGTTLAGHTDAGATAETEVPTNGNDSTERGARNA